MSRSTDIEIISHSKLGELYSNSPGFGIFLKMGAARLNVGAILQIGENLYQLNILVADDFPGLEYDACDLSEQFGSVEEAADAAYKFLGPKKRPTVGDRAAAAKIATHLLEREHSSNPPMAILAMDIQQRLCESDGYYSFARALQEKMDEICRQWGTTPEEIQKKL